MLLNLMMSLFAAGRQVASIVSAHPQPLSRHLITNDLSTVVVLADALTPAGPQVGLVKDYVEDSDMVMPAFAGFSKNQTVNRTSVLQGIPMNLTIAVYDITTAAGEEEDRDHNNNNLTGGQAMSNLEVYLWNCDALRIYSATDNALFATPGQHWLRGKQITDSNGRVQFRTIVPGWYTSRSLHYHLRLRRPGDVVFSATTNIFFPEDKSSITTNNNLSLAEELKTIYPYTENHHRKQTSHEKDIAFGFLDSRSQELLTLDLVGSVEDGFSANLSLGLQFVNGAALSAAGEDGSHLWQHFRNDDDDENGSQTSGGYSPMKTYEYNHFLFLAVAAMITMLY